MLHDIRFGLRTLARNPGMTAAAVLSLALGIGANVTVFNLINSTLLRPLPVRDPGRLAYFHHRGAAGFATGFAHPDYLDLAAQHDLFEGVAAWQSSEAVIESAGAVERARAEVASANYFAVVSPSMALGRGFAEGETGVAVIGETVWKRLFNSDQAVLGQTLRINGQPFTVVGVAGGGFAGVEAGSRTALWLPLSAHDILMPWGGGASPEQVRSSRFQSRGTEWLDLVGRLRPGVAEAQAGAALAAFSTRSSRMAWEVGISPAARGAMHPGARREVAERMFLFLGVAALVLLSACANVASLLLARGAARGREIAIRMAVGAGRGRLVRQLLTESMLLAVAGGGAAVLAAMWAGGLLGGMRLPGGWSPQDLNLTPDGRVYAFALLLSVAAGAVCGLVPALRAASSGSLSPARQLGRYSPGGLRGALVVAQVSLSLLLLIGAGLLLRSLEKRMALDPGLTRQNLLLVAFEAGPGEARGNAFYRDLLDRTRRIPGVHAAGLAAIPPLSLRRMRWNKLEGNAVSAGYFEAMGIRILEGRGFTDADTAASSPVAVVDQRTARIFWPGASAVGRELEVGRERLTVVGVAEDSRHRDIRGLLGTPGPFVYVNAAGNYSPNMTLMVRAAVPAGTLVPSIDREARALDRQGAPRSARTARQHVNEIFAQERSAAALAGVLGGIALALALAGIYGVVSHWVVERTHEIGVRMALGARQRHALALVLGRAAALAGGGVALGLGLSLLLTRALAGMLFGVSARDPLVFAAAGIVLFGVALAAGYLPARRAARVDPVIALRYE